MAKKEKVMLMNVTMMITTDFGGIEGFTIMTKGEGYIILVDNSRL